jgi:hypothetical protein
VSSPVPALAQLDDLALEFLGKRAALPGLLVTVGWDN